jgi:hypothetical protein
MWHAICSLTVTMKSHASRRVALILVLAGLAGLGWLLRPVQGSTGNPPAGGVPRIHDDGQHFVAFYGQLEKPLTLLETWRVLRGLRIQMEREGVPGRRIAGFVYYAADDIYLAAVDFEANEVFIDRAGARTAFTLIWHQVEADFSPAWSLRAPDRIESSEPSSAS